MRTLLAGDRRVTRVVLKIVRRIWEVGVAGSPVMTVDGGRSQHYCGGLDCGLPLMAFWQQSERKMLASTCLYSLYAWFIRELSQATQTSYRAENKG